MPRVTVLALLSCLAVSGAWAEDVGQSEKIELVPPNGRVGTRFDVICKNFPEPVANDAVYIVAAGSPDVDPNSPTDTGVKILWKDYAANCYRNQGRFFDKAGPFAPGQYEIRFSTELYNNDHRKETATRTAFSVK